RPIPSPPEKIEPSRTAQDDLVDRILAQIHPHLPQGRIILNDANSVDVTKGPLVGLFGTAEKAGESLAKLDQNFAVLWNQYAELWRRNLTRQAQARKPDDFALLKGELYWQWMVRIADGPFYSPMNGVKPEPELQAVILYGEYRAALDSLMSRFASDP